MTLLHLNVSSLPYYIDELTELLSDLEINFKIIRITESRKYILDPYHHILLYPP